MKKAFLLLFIHFIIFVSSVVGSATVSTDKKQSATNTELSSELFNSDLYLSISVVHEADAEKSGFQLNIAINGNGTVNVNDELYTEVLTFKPGTVIQISANSDPGWHFSEWSGDIDLDNADNPSVVITMPNNDINLEANFELTIFNITYNLNGGTNAAENPANFSIDDLPISLFDAEKEGFAFDGWFDNSDFTGDAITFIDEIDNIELWAKFSNLTYSLTLTANPTNSGNLLGAGDYNYNQPIPINAFANEGFEFINWTDSKDSLYSTIPFFAINMPAKDLELFANFNVFYKLSVYSEPEEGGNVEILPYQIYYDAGDTVYLNAVESEGWLFASWEGDTQYLTDPYNLQTMLIMPSQNVTLKANFYNSIKILITAPEFTQICKGIKVILDATAVPEESNLQVLWYYENGEFIGISPVEVLPKTTTHYQAKVESPWGIVSETIVIEVDQNVSLPQSHEIIMKTLNDKPVILIYPEADLTYQWFRDGVNINITEQYFYPKAGDSIHPGLYYVRIGQPDVQDGFFCITESEHLIISGTKAFEFEREEDLFNIYPNPASGSFTLLINELITGFNYQSINIRIFNSNGKQIKNLHLSNWQSEIFIDQIGQGLYFVDVFVDGYFRQVKKLIIK